MKTQNEYNTIPSKLVDFQEELGGVIEEGCGTHILRIDSLKGVGYVRCTALQSGIYAIDIVFTAKNVNRLLFCNKAKEILLFVFSISGQSYHQFGVSDSKQEIISHASLLVNYKENSIGQFIFKKGVRTQMNIILVEKHQYTSEQKQLQNTFAQSLHHSVNDIRNKIVFYGKGGYNPRISKLVGFVTIDQNTNTITNSLSYLGHYYVILAKHIEHFIIDTSSNTSTLLKKELKFIHELSEFIKTAPEKSHTIKSLCLASGLSPAKLQEGFKFIFERTVTDYVRYIRLQKAEYLITTTDMTISEIVYTVGLTSRSYFCKIFRNTYNCSPTEYKKHLSKSIQEHDTVKEAGIVTP